MCFYINNIFIYFSFLYVHIFIYIYIYMAASQKLFLIGSTPCYRIIFQLAGVPASQQASRAKRASNPTGRQAERASKRAGRQRHAEAGIGICSWRNLSAGVCPRKTSYAPWRGWRRASHRYLSSGLRTGRPLGKYLCLT